MKEEVKNNTGNNQPLVSVVIVTYNRKRAIELCLNSLYSQDYPSIEIIIIDNGSMSNTLNYLTAQSGKIKLFLNRINRGACIGRNQGFLFSKGDFILFLDSDVVLPDNKTISYALKEFSNNKLGELGGIGYLDKELTIVQHGLLVVNRYLGLDADSLKEIPTEINFDSDYVQTDFAMVRREVFEKTGGFDPFYFYYTEDRDLSLQIKKTGFLVGISPKIRFWHQYIPRRRGLAHGELCKDAYFIIKNLSLFKYFSYSFYFIKKNIISSYDAKRKYKNIFLFVWHLCALPFFIYFLIFSFIIRLRKKVNFLNSTQDNWFNEISGQILWFPIKLENKIIYFISDMLFWFKRKRGNRGLYLFVTNNCNLSCPHCFYKENINKRVKELTVAEIKNFCMSLADNIGGLTITGGEPFLRDDIVDICRVFQKHKPVPNINIITNGFTPELIKNKVKSILENKPENQRIMVTISLDGPEKTHDRIRGIEGSFRMAVATVNLLKEFLKDNPKFKLRVQMTLMNLNYNDFVYFYDFVIKGLRVEFSLNWFREGFVCGVSPDLINSFTNRDGGSFCSLPSLEECEDIYQFLLEREWEDLSMNLINKYSLEILREKKRIFPCVAPDLNLVIYPNGDISFCEMIRPLHNIRDFNYNLKKILSSSGWRKTIHGVNRCFCIHPCILGINMQKRHFVEFKFDQLRSFKIKKRYGKNVVACAEKLFIG